jgi:acetylornithine/succinyldiaminopimelate/putrescine aminotransferase
LNTGNTYNMQSVWRERAEETLHSILPGDYEFAFFSGGAEAVEAAVRVALACGYRIGRIRTWEGCFHGKTYLMENILPRTMLPWSGAPRLVAGDVALFEPVQTRNGVRQFLWWDQVKRADFLIDDEISTTVRSGFWTCYGILSRDGISPNIVLLGKNLGQGVPVTIMAVKSMDTLVPVSLSSGYGGNPLACAAVTDTVRYIMDEGILEKIRTLGPPMASWLSTAIERPVDGLGFWFGFSVRDAEDGAFGVAHRMLEQGYIIGTAGEHNIRLSPDFDTTLAEWEEFCDVLTKNV